MSRYHVPSSEPCCGHHDQGRRGPPGSESGSGSGQFGDRWSLQDTLPSVCRRKNLRFTRAIDGQGHALEPPRFERRRPGTRSTRRIRACRGASPHVYVGNAQTRVVWHGASRRQDVPRTGPQVRDHPQRLACWWPPTLGRCTRDVLGPGGEGSARRGPVRGERPPRPARHEEGDRDPRSGPPDPGWAANPPAPGFQRWLL